MTDKFIYLAFSAKQNGQDVINIKKIFIWGQYIKPYAGGQVRGFIEKQHAFD